MDGQDAETWLLTFTSAVFLPLFRGIREVRLSSQEGIDVLFAEIQDLLQTQAAQQTEGVLLCVLSGSHEDGSVQAYFGSPRLKRVLCLQNVQHAFH